MRGSRRLDVVERGKRFALGIIRFFGSLPRSNEAQVLGKQMLRSGTSVGAHLREGRRSRSDAELISKFEVALQELDETLYWLELLQESGVVGSDAIQPLRRDGDELVSMLVSAVKTIKKRRSLPRSLRGS